MEWYRLVAEELRSYAIAYSYDGINWTGVPNSATLFSQGGNGVVWNGSLFVAVGQGPTDTYATSPDGITWTGRGAAALDTAGFGVAWNGSLFVAVGEGTSDTIATSPDGITWTGRGTTAFDQAGLGIAWNGYRWIRWEKGV